MISKATKVLASIALGAALLNGVGVTGIDVGNPRFPWIVDEIVPDTTPNIETPEGRDIGVEAPTQPPVRKLRD